MKLKQLILAIALTATLPSFSQNVNREFRGAWMHTVFQAQYKKNTTRQNKEYLCRQLDSLRMVGINAVIFQVRPQADAFYKSEIEPWSCYLTDGGKAPEPYWDPLEFMVQECHKRGMELHAWLNPYRVTSNTRQISSLPKKHIYRKHPERFVTYGGKLYFDPGLPENREFIGKVVDDIIARYDIDGIHFDDYFYPYPVKGKAFPDNASYAKYGKGMKRADWRRQNVDLLIEDIHRRIAAAKPWVRFGISPFGIYRNKKNNPDGSDTNGLETYEALYADVIKWEREGWIDYLMPQLYWPLDHKAAPYTVLLDWWNRSAGSLRHLYIGQDVVRTMTVADTDGQNPTQLRHKLDMARKAENIQGNCYWPGYELCRNTCGVADSLMTKFNASPALVPSYPWISTAVPERVEDLRPTGEKSFKWKPGTVAGKTEDVVKYAVYRFDSRNDINLSKQGALIDIVTDSSYAVTEPGIYVVTAINRVNNESEASSPVVIR